MEEQAARFRVDLEALTGAAPERLALAVSGGPDSLALLLLARAACPGRVEAATVDHGLRPESAAEAEFVAGLCGRLGVPHATLRAGMTDGPNLQAAARARRYALLGGWAREIGADCLLTAHHLDDQAETLVMRLMRGSGLAGLAGIRAVNPPLVRPLLGWRRAELAAIVEAAGIRAVADPSNTDERFDRARARRRLADADWLDPASLARSAAALAEAEEALDWAAERLWRERADGATLDPAGLPAELRRRLVLRMIAALGGPAPRGDRLGRLLATLEKGGTATLSGIKCAGGTRWRFAPAPPRRR
ncbi:MAG TPA: tRNA lysidine(34) synthetase TilS [Allosphingosinicella sp.]|nr:tRNA lysidine(34) synthetase TilS [Allosphingosinicella sp.]